MAGISLVGIVLAFQQVNDVCDGRAAEEISLRDPEMISNFTEIFRRHRQLVPVARQTNILTGNPLYNQIEVLPGSHT